MCVGFFGVERFLLSVCVYRFQSCNGEGWYLHPRARAECAVSLECLPRSVAWKLLRQLAWLARVQRMTCLFWFLYVFFYQALCCWKSSRVFRKGQCWHVWNSWSADRVTVDRLADEWVRSEPPVCCQEQVPNHRSSHFLQTRKK